MTFTTFMQHLAMPLVSLLSFVIAFSIMWGRFRKTIEVFEDRLKSIEAVSGHHINDQDCANCRVNLLSKMEDLKSAMIDLTRESRNDRNDLHKEAMRNKELVMEEFKTLAEFMGQAKAELAGLREYWVRRRKGEDRDA
jgi:hypothetical protein